MTFEDAIRREINGKEAYDPAQRKPSRQRGNRGGNRGHGNASRPKQPTAGDRASLLAQRWYDLAQAHGFDLPYDVNYLALQFQSRLSRDARFLALDEAGRQEDADRLFEKMTDVWWRDYVNGEVTARNAKDYFLTTDWDALQDYALSSLRAAYLKAHGRPVSPPEYPQQQEFQDTLEHIRVNARVEQILETEERPPLQPLDNDRRERLRSFAENHGRRKK